MTNIDYQQEPQQIQKTEIQYSPLRLIGILTLSVFFTVLLIVATFTRIKVFNCLQPIVGILHPDFFPTIQDIFTLKSYFYIPQIPVILFAASLLGGACSMISVFLYVVIGLAFLPVFGLGGGFDYILQPTFGYILAFIPAALIAGKLTEKEYTLKNLFLASLVAVIVIHTFGFIYMFIISMIKHSNIPYITDWLIFESFTRAIYDLFFGFICMYIAKHTKKIIWILTSV